MEFFKENKTVEVSKMDKNGYWVCNQKEFVTKGTSLGEEFTQNIYIPSSLSMTAKFDKKNNSWGKEIDVKEQKLAETLDKIPSENTKEIELTWTNAKIGEVLNERKVAEIIGKELTSYDLDIKNLDTYRSVLDGNRPICNSI